MFAEGLSIAASVCFMPVRRRFVEGSAMFAKENGNKQNYFMKVDSSKCIVHFNTLSICLVIDFSAKSEP